MWMRAMSDVDDDEGKLRIGLNEHRVEGRWKQCVPVNDRDGSGSGRKGSCRRRIIGLSIDPGSHEARSGTRDTQLHTEPLPLTPIISRRFLRWMLEVVILRIRMLFPLLRCLGG